MYHINMYPALISHIEIEFLLALLLSMLCGFIIGSEREMKDKPAGISTQTLVISASMLFTFLGREIIGGDPTRIASGIVTGVGFLGAGVILRSERDNHVTNLTTAASIWYAAAVGMALGFGYYFIAITAAAFAVIISRVPRISSTHEG